ncbi:metal-binding protein [[Phormidium ambiguum] IAM M-71]|uniref:Metal-binding protein n=1 Tax=[Phormidium ambiguum] IAM M-71 TaxID=454136 RepID=A0A1U7I798_9CYAN|nr:metal-binding protein [Phormidium ambiguum]OKH32266.1 metal-binding protein [Phormidium ambiguum IAM M-71]
MPSGRTHDRITFWILPVVAVLTFVQTQSGSLTLLVSGGFLFGGLMFGPDLDIYSRQFQRWGYLRWIWIPYQKSLRHRSFLSHGPIIGTALRSLYLGLWIIIVGGLVIFLADLSGVETTDWKTNTKLALASAPMYQAEAIALLVGLELGAMSHSFSDWGGSAVKRFKSSQSKATLSQSSGVKKRSSSKLPKQKIEKQTTKTRRTRSITEGKRQKAEGRRQKP